MLLIHKQILYKIVLLLICTFIANISIANTTEEIKAYALFGQEGMPSAQDLNSIGSYSKGCLAGAEKLPETGKSWQVMRLSRNRNWGHQNTLKFVYIKSNVGKKTRYILNTRLKNQKDAQRVHVCNIKS